MSGRAHNQGQSYGVNNNNQAQLGNAYQELVKELGSDHLKVIGGYTLGRVIGEGTFGSVHIATHRLTGTRCAVKKIPKSATAQLIREIHHHRRLHHPHIVHLHEIVATESHVWLVSELCSGGELFDYLVERGRLPEGEARRIFGELSVAVGWLHRKGVVHRDLKLENVLLDGELRVKLGDLGFAREWHQGRLMDTFCGTTGYASPEMLACRKYLGVETDIWSLGVILYALLCGGLPFDDDDERVMKEKITAGDYEEPEWLSQESRSLIREILKIDPTQRLSIEGILKHSWFKMAIVETSLPPTPNPGSSADHRSSHDVGTLSRVSELPDTEVPEPASDSASLSRSGSGVTTPTTPNGDTVVDRDVRPSITRNNSGEFSQTERQLELLHPNYHLNTSRQSGPGVEIRSSTAVDEASDTIIGSVDAPFALPLHSRTPSRTKRRSVSSQISLERRHSYAQNTAVDYWRQLNEERTEVFSRPSEKHLIKSLTSLGIDIGQLKHSVRYDACDSAAALWWILRAKQLERGETDEAVEAMDAAIARRRERAAAYSREERRRARETVSDHHTTLDPIASGSAPAGSDSVAQRQAAPHSVTLGAPVFASLSPKTPSRESPARQDESPPSSRSPRLKARSPSLSMLQRATSALTGKWTEERVLSEDNGRISPTKLVKPQPKTKSEHEAPSNPSSPKATTRSSRRDLPNDLEGKGSKRDSLWSTFRHLFAEDRKRKRYPMTSGQIKISPAVVLSRGAAARSPHVNRLPQPASRRASLDVRPNMYSRRSSSVNSRRSSLNSTQIGPEQQDAMAPLGRHASRRSHGSQTPTSDREHFDFPSRPNSATSFRHASGRHSSNSLQLRSPSLLSDNSTRVPASPLHDYQRRHPSGSNSRRVRHFTVIPEAKVIRSESVASSIRSNASSRRSSLDKNKADDMAGDSDYDTGRDDASVHSSRRRSASHHVGTQQIHRNRSPLARASFNTHPIRIKNPPRDVFNQGDDDWVDEDESPTFQGGLGQPDSTWQSNDKSRRRAASFPISAISTRASDKPFNGKAEVSNAKRSDSAGSHKAVEGRGESGSRRAGLPERSGKPTTVMEEVEEEDEEGEEIGANTE